MFCSPEYNNIGINLVVFNLQVASFYILQVPKISSSYRKKFLKDNRFLCNFRKSIGLNFYTRWCYRNLKNRNLQTCKGRGEATCKFRLQIGWSIHVIGTELDRKLIIVLWSPILKSKVNIPKKDEQHLSQILCWLSLVYTPSGVCEWILNKLKYGTNIRLLLQSYRINSITLGRGSHPQFLQQVSTRLKGVGMFVKQ